MRRIGLLVVFLTLLSLTTAFAASLDVRADNLSSSRTDVSISVPADDGPPFFLAGTSGLAAAVDGNQHSENLKPGDYFEWETGELASGLVLIGTQVQLIIYTNSNTGEITARLYECDETQALPATGCTQISEGFLSWTGNGIKTVDFSPPSKDIEPGHRLRLRIANEVGTDQSGWNLQWGKEGNGRDSRLVISDPAAP